MRNFILAWVVLLIVVAIFAQQTFGFDVRQILELFWALPPIKQFMLLLLGFMALWLIGSAVWQAERLVRQDKALKTLQGRLDGVRQATMQMEESQHDAESAVRHLVSSDPEEAITSLQARIADAEHRTSAQQSRNEAVDMNDRLTDIRRRQQTLREKLGEVIEKRRAIEPVFGELKERQGHLDRSLAELETDDNRASIGDRLKELDSHVMQTNARLQALQEALATLTRFNNQLNKAQTDLVPLGSPDAGIEAMITKVRALGAQLGTAIASLESNGDRKLVDRVEALSKDKLETEQRIASLNESFAVLDAINRDLEELKTRQEQLDDAFARVETDAKGRSLADRLSELDEFAAQARTRLRTLQDSLVTLGRYKDDLNRSHGDVVPLLDPAAGIEALIAEVVALRDQLARTVSELEVHDGHQLAARVEALAKSKLEAEQRVAQLADCFARLGSTRNDISGLFTKLSITLDRHTSYSEKR